MSTATATREALIVTTSVPWETIANLMISFVESGDPVTRSWCSSVRATEDSLRRWRALPRSAHEIWYSEASFWSRPNWQITLVTEKGTEDEELRVLGLRNFEAALVLLADGKYRHHFADIVSQNTDAATADIFMQMAVFGEEKYA